MRKHKLRSRIWETRAYRSLCQPLTMTKELLTQDRFERIRGFYIKEPLLVNKVEFIQIDDEVEEPDCLAFVEIEYEYSATDEKEIVAARVVVLTNPTTVSEYIRARTYTEAEVDQYEISLPFTLETDEQLIDWLLAEEISHVLISSHRNRDDVLTALFPDYIEDPQNTHDMFPIEILVSRIALLYFIHNYPEKSDEAYRLLKESVRTRKAVQPYVMTSEEE